MKIIKSLALAAFAVAATIGFSACETKGTASTQGASVQTSTTSSK